MAKNDINHALCKLCRQQRGFVDAHIIPRWAYDNIIDNGMAYKVPGNPKQYVGKTHNGIYDPGLVCEECEALFSKPDTVAKSFFADTRWDQIPVSDLNPNFQIVQDFDCDSLQMFMLSLLWRASASSRFELTGFKLGEQEERLRTLLLNKSLGENSEFVTLLTRLTYRQAHDDIDPRRVIGTPVTTKIDGMQVTGTYLSGFRLLTYTDPKAPPEKLVAAALRTGRPASIALLPFSKTEFYQDIIQNAKRRVGDNKNSN